ncbi:MAG: primosomal protein N' [Flavobacteriaceae bacterium]|nr:primosomal protein N' [Flavobacteriaceae bacterium]
MPFDFDAYIEVVLPLRLEKCFTYGIDKEQIQQLKIGMRVSVPFGKSKIFTALVLRIHPNPPEFYEAKPIHQILDTQPVVREVQLAHWKWIADYYMCTLGEVYKSAMPKTFLLESETVIYASNLPIEEGLLADEEFLVYEALQHQSSLKIADVMQILDKKTVIPVLKRMLEKGALWLQEELYEQYKPKLVKYVKLSDDYGQDSVLEALLQELKRAQKQQQAVMGYFGLRTKYEHIKLKQLLEYANVNTAVIQALEKKGILEIYNLQEYRKQDIDTYTVDGLELNVWQQNAMDAIAASFDQKKVCLLHGITGSGKTEVYIKQIELVLEKGKQVLYLLPEIALTVQLIKRLKAYFPEQILVYHSKYNLQERTDVWNQVLEGNDRAQIVLGARSALFLPFNNLGLIVVDEEHESSFKQFDPAPRYHARDAAIVLGKLHESSVLLGSATPSVESFANAKQGKYGLANIDRRYQDIPLPDIELVNLKDKYKRKRMQGHFSDRLIEAIEAAIQENGQVILFQNRRGFAPIMECKTCGHSPQCPNCDVSLTYHKLKNQLRCHYCGYHMAVVLNCLACGETNLSLKGLGTEQVQAELEEIFPSLRVRRMDLDTTRGKHSYEKIISDFEQGEIDVLVGTQMLSKGLNFKNVRLVGVMNADNLLYMPDYRAHERAYQLLEQVSGRAGRHGKQGKVIIQSYDPNHRILQQLSTHSYFQMFKEQWYHREQFKYPPALRMIRIVMRHRDYNKLNDGANWFAKSLRAGTKTVVLGPEFPPVMRIRNQYIQQILVKMPKGLSLLQTKQKVKRIQSSFESISQFKGVQILYHVDHI